jgi:hypothetical protein
VIKGKFVDMAINGILSKKTAMYAVEFLTGRDLKLLE